MCFTRKQLLKLQQSSIHAVKPGITTHSANENDKSGINTSSANEHDKSDLTTPSANVNEEDDAKELGTTIITSSKPISSTSNVRANAEDASNENVDDDVQNIYETHGQHKNISYTHIQQNTETSHIINVQPNIPNKNVPPITNISTIKFNTKYQQTHLIHLILSMSRFMLTLDLIVS